MSQIGAEKVEEAAELSETAVDAVKEVYNFDVNNPGLMQQESTTESFA